MQNNEERVHATVSRIIRRGSDAALLEDATMEIGDESAPEREHSPRAPNRPSAQRGDRDDAPESPDGAIAVMSPWSARRVFRLEDQVEHLPDLAVGAEGMTKRQFHVDSVTIASAFTHARQITSLLQVADDPLNRATSDPHAFGHVAEPYLRFLGDAYQDMGVITEESPTGRPCHDARRLTTIGT